MLVKYVLMDYMKCRDGQSIKENMLVAIEILAVR